MAAEEKDADILFYYDAASFCEDAANGKTFDRPVVIQEKFTDTSMHTITGYAHILKDRYKKIDASPLEQDNVQN
jgi:hypothetical protein